MGRHAPLRQIIACLLLPTYLAACTTWKTQEASPQQVLADEQPDRVRVELADGSRIVLEHPVVSGDTLMGVEERWSARKRVPGNETIGLSFITLSFIGAVAFLVACSDPKAWC
jgi:hypothetical protein